MVPRYFVNSSLISSLPIIIPSEYFIASFHVRQDGVVEDIGHQGQHLIGDQVPEHRHAVRAP